MSGPRFDPASYPGRRPDGPVLVHRGEVSPLGLGGELPSPLVGASAPVLEVQHELRWSVAYGSNASPERLVDKGLDAAGAVLVPARLVGWVPAFEARRTGYGAVPLTLVPQADAQIATWLLGLRVGDLDELDRTEGRVRSGDDPAGEPSSDPGRYAPPGTYRLGRVGDVAVADRFLVRGALAYLPGEQTLVQHTGGAWRSWPEHDQAAAGAALERDQDARTAPTAEPVLGPWPSTPMEDLPLFVYGTLQPDRPAWQQIIDLVEVIGPASTPGQLWDTGNGWPAAVFDQGAGAVHGTLLVAKDPAAAGELFARADTYEGVPQLFRRVAIRVTQGGGERWAASYTWADHRPIGEPIPGGHWLPDGRQPD